MGDVQQPNGGTTLALVVAGVVDDQAIEALCARLRRLLADDCSAAPGAPVTCDVGNVAAPDLVTVNALARLQLVAERRGRSIRLQQPSPVLVELIRFVGLEDVLQVDL